MKTGPFAEHSNQLWNISAVPSWSKVNQGLIRMYKAEVSGVWPACLPLLSHGPTLRLGLRIHLVLLWPSGQLSETWGLRWMGSHKALKQPMLLEKLGILLLPVRWPKAPQSSDNLSVSQSDQDILGVV